MTELAAYEDGQPVNPPGSPQIHAESFDPYAYPLEPRWFKRPESIHGLSHTRRVLIHCCAIAASVALDPDEFESLALAVAWHDIGRTHDGRDPEHGAKSVVRAKELGLSEGVDPRILARVLFAVELHSINDETVLERPTPASDSESKFRVLWVLKDADGLDRVRIYDLDSRRLRYPISRDRVDKAWELLDQLP